MGRDWADEHIKRLAKGETVTFRPRGRSMEPLVMDNQEVTVEPVLDAARVSVGDVVLCRVGPSSYLHLVKGRAYNRVRGSDVDELVFQIGNNRGGVNGWISGANVFGKMVRRG